MKNRMNKLRIPEKNEADETIKTFSRLSLFTKDLSFDPLIAEPTGINNQ